MRDISIKVVIGGRTYPLTVKAEEEENVLRAAKNIEDRLKELDKNYSVRDKQDLLAMCALQYANEVLQHQNKNKIEEEGIVEKIDVIEALLNNYLEKV